MRRRQSLSVMASLCGLALSTGCSCSASVKGRPLKMSLKGYAADNLFAGEIARRTSLLCDVKGWATDEAVVVSFDMQRSGWSPINEGYRLIIRLFDKNGIRLTEVITKEKFTPEERLKGRFVLLHAKGNKLKYPVSVRDLRDAAMAEVGFYDSHKFGSRN